MFAYASFPGIDITKPQCWMRHARSQLVWARHADMQPDMLPPGTKFSMPPSAPVTFMQPFALVVHVQYEVHMAVLPGPSTAASGLVLGLVSSPQPMPINAASSAAGMSRFIDAS